MKGFKLGQRVFVAENTNGIVVMRRGTVWRLMTRGPEAWIRLDERHPAGPLVHPFPDGDKRDTLVSAMPDGCRVAR